jgi:large subunit ribosomal protein L10
MARPDKAAAVAELTDAFRDSSAAVLTEYRGLTVAQLKELRRSLAGNATYAVVKNTLTKIAAKEAGVDTLDSLLEGPSAIAFITGDPVEVAKSLRDFGRNHPLLVVKGGVLEGKALSADEVRKLADLESREVLLAKLAGAMKASLSQAVGLFAAPLSQAARLLAALEEQKRSEPQPATEAPAAEAPVAEQPVAEAPVAEAAVAEAPTDDSATAEAPTDAELPTDGTPGVEETPDTTAAAAAGDEGAAAQAVADATDVPSDTDVAPSPDDQGDATSTS